MFEVSLENQTLGLSFVAVESNSAVAKLGLGLIRKVFLKKLSHEECAKVCHLLPGLSKEVQKVTIPFSLVKWDLIIKPISKELV